ncbi:grd-15 [Pristionchus pacificus]|uniref:Grd-15 n=1 Tax=Pristionchus pacificus TaxID=54126 RepID=A0A2A6B782_PRIPA|nr:grd-15 [Pristionchus pacificus]|eukprot:PDM61728.1 grd-15 [Pristionchus pacificus]
MIRLLAPLIFLHAVEASNNFTVEQVEVFSAPPSNLPLTKVEVMGKQVFVRQPLSLPKREVSQFDDITAKLFSPFIARVDGVSERVTTTTTRAPPTKAVRTRRNYGGSYGGGYDTYPQKPKYPLSQCFTNDAGFMCCNKKLQSLIHDTFANLTADPKFQNCNTQKIANELQNKAQEAFGTDFEAITAIGDFASKTHFYSDLICKTEKAGRCVYQATILYHCRIPRTHFYSNLICKTEKRFMLAYATPNRHTKPPTPPADPPAYRKFREALDANKAPLVHTRMAIQPTTLFTVPKAL